MLVEGVGVVMVSGRWFETGTLVARKERVDRAFCLTVSCWGSCWLSRGCRAMLERCLRGSGLGRNMWDDVIVLMAVQYNKNMQRSLSND